MNNEKTVWEYIMSEERTNEACDAHLSPALPSRKDWEEFEAYEEKIRRKKEGFRADIIKAIQER